MERRTRSAGRDLVDHPPKGHDDLANAVAGVCSLLAVRRAAGPCSYETVVRRRSLAGGDGEMSMTAPDNEDSPRNQAGGVVKP